MSVNLTNPYVGPRAFRRQERLYGRDREARQLFDLLIAERIVLLHAPSGAGKTSLVQAGLIPLLEQDGFAVPPVMRVNRLPLTPDLPPETNRYVLSLLLYLDTGLPVEAQSDEPQLAALTLDDYLQERQELLSGGRYPIFIFDQFEECLTLDPYDHEAKHAFFAQLGAALRNRGRWALFAIRDDFVAGLEPYLRPLPTRLNNHFHLDLLDRSAAAEAIRKPAEQHEISFDPDAAAHLIKDLSKVQIQRLDGAVESMPGPYVEPVQLQVVCRRLWDRLQESGRLEDGISDADVAEMGEVSQALSGYYRDTVFRAALEARVEERDIREWVGNQLITEQGIRGQVLHTPGKSQGLKNEAIAGLVQAHLVRQEERRGVLWYELAHDRLIEPVQRDNRLWREENLSRLQMQAEMWQKNGRDTTLLLTHTALKEAEAWAEANRANMTALDHEFLRACRKNQAILNMEREREEMERHKQRQELQAAKERAEAEQKLADVERQRAATQARLNLVFRRLTIALGALFIIAVAATIFANRASREAQASELLAQTNAAAAAVARVTAEAAATQAAIDKREAERQAVLAATAQAQAETSANIALTEQAKAIDAQVAAEASAKEAEDARNRAQAIYLSSQSLLLTESNRNLALLLAIEALKLDQTADTLRVLETALLPESTSLTMLTGVQTATLSLDNQWFFGLTQGGEPVLADTNSFSQTFTFPAAAAYSQFAFDSTSRYLALSTQLRIDLYLLSPDTNPCLIGSILNDRLVTQLIWQGDIAIISGDDGGQVKRWTLPTPLPGCQPERNISNPSEGNITLPGSPTLAETFTIISPIPVTTAIRYLAWNSYGDVLIFLAQDAPKPYRWDVRSERGEQIPLPDEVAGRGVQAAAAGGDRFLFWRPAGSIVSWDVYTQQQITSPSQEKLSASVQLSLSSNPFLFATQNELGAVTLWNADSLTRQFTLTPCPTAVTATAFLNQANALIIACQSGELLLWDIGKQQVQRSIGQLNDPITRLIVANNDAYLLVITSQNQGQYIPLVTDTSTRLVGHQDVVSGLVYLPTEDNSYALLSASRDETLRYWAITNPPEALISQSTPFNLRSEESPSYTQLAYTQAGEQEIIAYQGVDGQMGVRTLVNPVGGVSSDLARLEIAGAPYAGRELLATTFSPDQRWLVIEGIDTRIHLYEVAALHSAAEPAPWLILQPPGITTEQYAFSPDGQWLAALVLDNAYNGLVYLWHLPSLPEKQLEPIILQEDFSVSALAFTPNGEFLLAATTSGDLWLWDTTSLINELSSPLARLILDNQPITVIAFAENGEWWATGGSGGVKLWPGSLLTNPRSQTPESYYHHLNYISSLLFTPDGQWLTWGTWDGLIYLVATEQEVDIDERINTACNQTQFNFELADWEKYMAAGRRLIQINEDQSVTFHYQPTCPGQPVPLIVIAAWLAQVEQLAASGETELALTMLQAGLAWSVDFQIENGDIDAARRDPEQYVVHRQIDNLMQRGHYRVGRGDVAGAAALFNQALSLDETYAAAHINGETDGQWYAWQQWLQAVQSRQLIFRTMSQVQEAIELLGTIAAAAPDLIPAAIGDQTEQYMIGLALYNNNFRSIGTDAAWQEALSIAQLDGTGFWLTQICGEHLLRGDEVERASLCESLPIPELTAGQVVTGFAPLYGGAAYTFSVEAGQQYVIQMTGWGETAAATGFMPYPLIYSQEEWIYPEQYDFSGRRFAFTAPETGSVWLLLGSYYSNTAGHYELLLLDEGQQAQVAEVEELQGEATILALDGQISEALRRLNQAININPLLVHPDIRQAPLLHLQRLAVTVLVDEGYALAYTGEVDGAIAVWTEAVEINPELVEPAIRQNPSTAAVALALGSWLETVTPENADEAAALVILNTVDPYLAELENGYFYFRLCRAAADFTSYPDLEARLTQACSMLLDLARPLTHTIITGQIGSYQGELWSFSGTAGQTIQIEMQGVVNQDALLDTYLYLLRADGVWLADNDDYGSSLPPLPLGTDSRIVFTLPQDGVYIIVAAGFSSSSGSYQLRLTFVAP